MSARRKGTIFPQPLLGTGEAAGEGGEGGEEGGDET